MKKLEHNILLALVTVALLLCFSATALADGTIAEADFNNGAMHWSIGEDNVLTILGSGDMPDYSSSVNAPWYGYRSQINGIVVEAGVTSLGDYAFYGLGNAETVELAETVAELGDYCFYQCSKLEAIVIPEGVSEIPYYAFRNCEALASVELPGSMRSFGGYAFYDCNSLTEIEIPEGVENFCASDCFRGCYSLQSITLPSTLKAVGGWWMFSGTNISEIHFNGTLAQWLGI